MRRPPSWRSMNCRRRAVVRMYCRLAILPRLTAAAAFGGADRRVASKLGVTDKEVAKLCDAVAKALEKAHWIRTKSGKKSDCPRVEASYVFLDDGVRSK